MSKIVNVYSWKPEGATNFGDHIAPLLVERLARLRGVSVVANPVQHGQRKLLAVGSILQYAEEGDHVWGAGVNGKTWLATRIAGLQSLTIHSVRGPISRQALQNYGHDVPERYGDPGLLFPVLFHAEIETRKREIAAYYHRIGRTVPNVVFVPNVNDEKYYLPEAMKLPRHIELVSPRSDPVTVAAHIALADRTISSSLHGIVFADAYRKPVTFVASRFESLLKYEDYFLGTGRDPVYPGNPEIGITAEPNVAPFMFDIGSIADSFPLLQESGLLIDPPELPPLVRDEGDSYLVDPTALGEGEGWIVMDGPRFWTHRIARLTFDVAQIAEAETLLIYGGRAADERIAERFQVRIDNTVVPSRFVFTDTSGNWKASIPLKHAVAGVGSTIRIELDSGIDAPAGQAFSSRHRKSERVSLSVRKVVISKVRAATPPVLPPLVREEPDSYVIDPAALGEAEGWIVFDGPRYWTHRVARLIFDVAQIAEAETLLLYGGRAVDERIAKQFQVRIDNKVVPSQFVFTDTNGNWKATIRLKGLLTVAGPTIRIELDSGIDALAGEAFSARQRGNERVSLSVRKIVISKIRAP